MHKCEPKTKVKRRTFFKTKKKNVRFSKRDFFVLLLQNGAAFVGV